MTTRRNMLKGLLAGLTAPIAAGLPKAPRKPTRTAEEIAASKLFFAEEGDPEGELGIEIRETSAGSRTLNLFLSRIGKNPGVNVRFTGHGLHPSGKAGVNFQLHTLDGSSTDPDELAAPRYWGGMSTDNAGTFLNTGQAANGNTKPPIYIDPGNTGSNSMAKFDRETNTTSLAKGSNARLALFDKPSVARAELPALPPHDFSVGTPEDNAAAMQRAYDAMRLLIGE